MFFVPRVSFQNEPTALKACRGYHYHGIQYSAVVYGAPAPYSGTYGPQGL